jgi:hypothetical protein
VSQPAGDFSQDLKPFALGESPAGRLLRGASLALALVEAILLAKGGGQTEPVPRKKSLAGQLLQCL